MGKYAMVVPGERMWFVNRGSEFALAILREDEVELWFPHGKRGLACVREPCSARDVEKRIEAVLDKRHLLQEV